ncbi:MAG: TRAP transporter small permease [Spirochaetes bacterium]|nr:TRAP transporter small permease [Spirochaetota bacterium]
MLGKILDTLDWLIDRLSVGLMGFLLVLTFANVIGRYIFLKSIFFAEELARFLFIWIVFLGAAIIIKTNGHIAVDLLPLKLRGKPAGVWLDLLINLGGLVFLVILFLGGIELAGTMNIYTSPALGIPIGYVYWAVPVGSVIMLLHTLLALFRLGKSFKKKK